MAASPRVRNPRRRLALLLAVLVPGGAVAAALTVAIAAPDVQAAPKANAVDRAFVREMIPHHEMAVEMARMAAMQGEHAEIKTAAKAIVKDQTAEIRSLERIARRLGVTPAKPTAHDQMMRDAHTLGLAMDQMGMSMDMSKLDGAKPFDRAFIDMMITHHQGAIRMARAERGKGRDAQSRGIARAIVTAQAGEIRQMNAWRMQWYGATSPSGGVPAQGSRRSNTSRIVAVRTSSAADASPGATSPSSRTLVIAPSRPTARRGT